MVTSSYLIIASSKDIALANSYNNINNEVVSDIQNISSESDSSSTNSTSSKPFSVSSDTPISQSSSSSSVIAVDHNRDNAIKSMENLFNKYSSPMRGYAHILYDQSISCGGDYKILVAIAGNESGFGRIPYKLYNPYGYLDGVTYSGWTESLTKISCAISKRFIVPCGNDLNCIIKKYGGADTNRQKWIGNIQFFINQLK